MKRLKLIAVLLLSTTLMSLSSCAQESPSGSSAKVPDAIVGKFHSQYPSAKDAEWEKEGGNWVAEYLENGLEREVAYNEKAEVVFSEQEIAPSAVPANIRAYVEANYPGHEIIEAEEWQSEAESGYDVELSKGGGELIFDSNGVFQGPENDDDDNEDDEDDE